MGQQTSGAFELHGPFSSKNHDASCELRRIIDMNDFAFFLAALKEKIQRRDSIGFLSPALLQRATPTKRDFDAVHEDVLSYRMKEAHLVYTSCSCKGRYGGMDLNRLDSRGLAAIHVAVRKRDSELLTILLSLGVDFEKASRWGLSPVHIACETGDIDTLRALIGIGADVNIVEKSSLRSCGNEHRSALLIAATHGRLECMAELLAHNADCNWTDCKGNSALHKAALYGIHPMVPLLVKHGADINKVNESGASPLLLAMMQAHKNTIKALLESGADVMPGPVQLPSMVTLAAVTGEVEVLEKCITSGHPFDQRDKSDRTPIYYTFSGNLQRLSESFPTAIEQGCGFDFLYINLPGRMSTLRKLIEHGADLDRMLCDLISDDILTVRHLGLTQNNMLFRSCLSYCRFNSLSNKEAQWLLWMMAGRNFKILVQILLTALPRLSCSFRPSFKDCVDWTGVHTTEAVVSRLEDKGLDTETALWVEQFTRGPRTLQEWSRQAIRAHLVDNVLVSAPSLPLPKRLQDFVMMDELC